MFPSSLSGIDVSPWVLWIGHRERERCWHGSDAATTRRSSLAWRAWAHQVQTLHDDAPMSGQHCSTLTAHWTPVSETASWQYLCSAASHQLIVPSHRLVTYGGRVFAVAGPSACNSTAETFTWPFFNSSSLFGRPVETFVFSEYLCMRRIRGFGEDALYTVSQKNKTPNS